MPESLRPTLDFLRDLRDDNTTGWFAANRKRYQAARDAFEDFVEDLIERFNVVDDLGGVTAQECLFRINRDIRFSADKSPYKVNMGALLARGGRKALAGRSYYLHIQPDGQSFLAGGLYHPSTEQLDHLRSAVARDSSRLRAIAADVTFTEMFGSLHGEALKTAPQGYSRDHPDIDLLRMKQIMASHPLTDADVLSDGLTDHILAVYTALKPLVIYLEQIAPSDLTRQPTASRSRRDRSRG